MKIGTENKKQMILLAVFGSLALIYVIYTVVQMNSSDSTPTPVATMVTVPAAPSSTSSNGSRAAAQVTNNAKLDPTLHMEGMLLAESLEYRGSGRNIFSMDSAPMPSLPKPVASARPVSTGPVTPVYTGPPPPPPINLRFFGTALRKGGTRQAFLLRGEDVFFASVGDIVSRRYKIVNITATMVEVTDLQNNNTQRIPLQAQ